MSSGDMPCPNCCRFGTDYFIHDRVPIRVPPCECRWGPDGKLRSERGTWMITAVRGWEAEILLPPSGPEEIQGRFRFREDARIFTGQVSGAQVAFEEIPGGPPRWSKGDVLRLVEETRPPS